MGSGADPGRAGRARPNGICPVRKEQYGPDINGLQELLIYGIKGATAYADHAQILGQEAEVIYAFFAEALSYLAEEKPTVDELLAMCLKCGEINLKIMEILDARPHRHLRPSRAHPRAR